MEGGGGSGSDEWRVTGHKWAVAAGRRARTDGPQVSKPRETKPFEAEPSLQVGPRLTGLGFRGQHGARMGVESAAMTPGEFARKWAASTATERASSQTHFNELCALLGEPGPLDDPGAKDYYAFERGAPKSGGGDGFADVWLRDHFGWEYKGKRKDLGAAYKQLLDYHEALGQPPLLVVCDLERFEVHTKWTNTESWVYRFSLLDLNRDAPVAVCDPRPAMSREANVLVRWHHR